MLESLFDRVLRDFRLDIVSKICDKSQTIVELNIKSLIVDGSPLSRNDLFVAFLSVFAEDSLSLVILSEVDIISVLGLEVELVGTCH